MPTYLTLPAHPPTSPSILAIPTFPPIRPFFPPAAAQLAGRARVGSRVQSLPDGALRSTLPSPPSPSQPARRATDLAGLWRLWRHAASRKPGFISGAPPVMSTVWTAGDAARTFKICRDAEALRHRTGAQAPTATTVGKITRFGFMRAWRGGRSVACWTSSSDMASLRLGDDSTWQCVHA